jgi:predicted nucleic acid-binding protein
MILVDTSSWIHFLRPDGDGDVRGRVESALRAGTARWCPLVRLELWNGAGGERERKVLREFERAGVTVPATDILIAACAGHHGAQLEHADGDFDAIARVSDRDGSR